METFGRVTQFFGQTVYIFDSTYNGKAVAYLQFQIGVCQQVETGTVYSRGVQSITHSQSQTTYFAPVEFGTRNQYPPRNNRSLNGFPVHLDRPADKGFQCTFVGQRKDHEKQIALLQNGVRVGDHYFVVVFYPGYHEVAVYQFGQIVECSPHNQFIFNFIGYNVRHQLARLVFFFDLLVLFFQFYLEDGTDKQHRGDNADYTQRIGGCIAEGYFGYIGNGTVEFKLRERLLCGTKPRCVCDGS